MTRLLVGLVAAAALLPGAARAGNYAPLDCAKAATPTELAICKSYALGQDEARMATLYSVATSLVAMGQRGAIQDEQRNWLDEREACGATVSCLAKSYATRIKELNGVIEQIASHGPF